MLRKVVVGLVLVLISSTALAASLSVAALEREPPLTVDEIAGRPMGDLIYNGLTDARFEARMQEFLAEHGLDHAQPAQLGPLSPIDAARSTLQEQARGGRTVQEWVQLARAENLLSLEGAPRPAADLVAQIVRLDAAAGVQLTRDEVAALQAQSDALPAEVRAPFAQLVAAVADAYVAQAPVAGGLVARVDDGGLSYLMTAEERAATVANALAIVSAQNAFRAAVEDVAFPASSAPLVADPAGLVFLGSTGDDVYARDGALGDAVLIVDPSGNDRYEQLAGGACPDVAGLIHQCNGLVASVVVDLAGDDDYVYEGVPTNAQGSGSLGGIGILVDVLGADSYYAHFVQTDATGPFWGGVTGYVDGGNQGYALAGFGLLLDAEGNDVYQGDVTSSRRTSVWGFSQGVGNAGGVGIASDGVGDDQWLAYGYDGGMLANGGFLFQGLYPGGTGFFGGIGVMTDTGLGRDAYHAWDNATTTDFYAYGFGAFGGTGIFYEDGGDDDYQAVESATDPFIVPLLNCAFGTASFAGLGAFLEMGGNDRYFGDSISPKRVATMNEGFGGPAEGEGVFLDVSGDDEHFMEAHSAFVNNYDHTYGRGILLGGGEGLVGNTIGVYLDLAGDDAYTGAAPSRNNAVWPAGLDLELGSVPEWFIS